MANKVCVVCSRTLSGRPKSCPYCAAKVMGRGLGPVAGWALTITIIALFVFAVTYLDPGHDQAEPPALPHSAVAAYTMCKSFVRDRLKAPRTAKFPWSASEATTDLGGGRYQVVSYVDAQNAFGAMLRTNYSCTVQWAGGDRWQLEKLAME